MQIFSSKRKSRLPGFTLIEVLVVVLIIGLSLSVLFRLDYSPGPRQVSSAARSFAQTADLILEEAVLGGDDWGIDFYSDPTRDGTVYSYRWLHHKDGHWQEDLPVGLDDLSVDNRLKASLSLQLRVEGMSADIGRKVPLDDPAGIPADFSPDVWLYPDHESTPFTVRFSLADYAPVLVASDMLGRIRIREPQP